MLNRSAVTVLPGTAIGIGNVFASDSSSWTYIGFWMEGGSTLVSRGSPTEPIIYATTKFVQEDPNIFFAADQRDYDFPFGIVSFAARMIQPRRMLRRFLISAIRAFISRQKTTIFVQGHRASATTRFQRKALWI